MKEIVSTATRRAFQDSYVSYAVLREISNDFDDAAVQKAPLPPNLFVNGQRRSLIEEYYRSIDWTSPAHVRRVLDAFESHLLRLQERGYTDSSEKLIRYLQRDNLVYRDGKIAFTAPAPILDDLVDHNLGLDVTQLRLNISRIKNAVEEDPDLAIGSSKELVEATCKVILTSLGISFPPDADIPKLVHLVAEALDLVATNVSEAKKGAQSIKRVLGSLSNIVQGLAELRNLYGSGHGKGPSQRGLAPRHARLAAGAAATLAMFVMETAREREASEKGAAPTST